MTLFLLVLLAALVFEYINGFHDAANSIATVVSTKVLTARQAIAMAAVCDLTGAFLGTAVAKTIGQGLVDTSVITMPTVLCALLAAIVWGLLTWWLGLLKDLYHGPCDAKELVILQELFEMVEQAVDRCRNAGNIVVQIVLKHS